MVRRQMHTSLSVGNALVLIYICYYFSKIHLTFDLSHSHSGHIGQFRSSSLFCCLSCLAWYSRRRSANYYTRSYLSWCPYVTCLHVMVSIQVVGLYASLLVPSWILSVLYVLLNSYNVAKPLNTMLAGLLQCLFRVLHSNAYTVVSTGARTYPKVVRLRPEMKPEGPSGWGVGDGAPSPLPTS